MPAPPILPGIYSLSGNELYIALWPQHQWIEGFSPRFHLAVSWIADQKHYPPYVHAAPLRTILSWWLKQHGLNGLHAAAIGKTTGGVLLGGAASSGKSTTAFACLNAGFLYLGDDFCILDFDPSPRVYSLYNSGKLTDDNRKWFPQLESTATGMKDDGKMIYLLSSGRKQQMVESLPVRAVLLPNLTKEQCTRLKPASGGEALNLLAPTTLKLMALPAGSLKSALGAIAKLVRQVPCYHLELGEDFTEIPSRCFFSAAVGDLMNKLRIPVVFILFNRPGLTRQVFNVIRQVQPDRLFLIADGPRIDRAEDVSLCAEARQVVDSVDWKCTVQKNYSAVNLGCGQRVVSGLNWVFEQVGEAIIIEDDTLPRPNIFSILQRVTGTLPGRTPGYVYQWPQQSRPMAPFCRELLFLPPRQYLGMGHLEAYLGAPHDFHLNTLQRFGC